MVFRLLALQWVIGAFDTFYLAAARRPWRGADHPRGDGDRLRSDAGVSHPDPDRMVVAAERGSAACYRWVTTPCRRASGRSDRATDAGGLLDHPIPEVRHRRGHDDVAGPLRPRHLSGFSR